MELATDFDLFSRGQWDDFRVWFFAGSDVCFVRLVYLMVGTQVPLLRGGSHVYPPCASGHCFPAGWRGGVGMHLLFLLFQPTYSYLVVPIPSPSLVFAAWLSLQKPFASPHLKVNMVHSPSPYSCAGLQSEQQVESHPHPICAGLCSVQADPCVR